MLYGKDFLNFQEKWVTQLKKKCCVCTSKEREEVYVYKSVSAAEQNLRFEIEKVIIHFHGGAFVAHNSFQHSSYTRQWANQLYRENVVVFSIDYRLAPENPFPAPFNDCW